MKKNSILEWTNLIATILGPVLIGWGIWSINMKLENAHLQIQQEMSDKYVTKGWFESANNTTNHRIDQLSDRMDRIGDQVSELNGKMKKTTPARN